MFKYKNSFQPEKNSNLFSNFNLNSKVFSNNDPESINMSKNKNQLL